MSNETVKIEIELPMIAGYWDVGLGKPKRGAYVRAGKELDFPQRITSDIVSGLHLILEPEPWKPEPGERYWTIGRGSISEQGLISRYRVRGEDTGLDAFLHASGMVYRTQAHANKVALAIRDLIKSMPEPTDGL